MIHPDRSTPVYSMLDRNQLSVGQTAEARSRRQSTDRSSDGLSLGVSPGETGGRTGHDGTTALLMASHHRYSVIRARVRACVD